MTLTQPVAPWAADRQPVDVVDFVEQTTYAIWNDRHPELVTTCYRPDSIIWGDAGDLVGEAAVTQSTRLRQEALPDYRGIIADTIWTGDAAGGYRTSMRWTAGGHHAAQPELGLIEPRWLSNSCIANCVILDGWYVEEWGTGNAVHEMAQLGLDPGPATLLVDPSRRPVGDAGWSHTRSLNVATPPIPTQVDGAGLFVVELLHDLYTARRLEVANRRYAAGAPYSFGVTRVGVGAAMVRSEVGRWLERLPDLELEVEELYWQDDAPGRSRVAVRYRLTGTGRGADGEERPVALTGIHHVHVRGDLVVAEWAEHDELALLAQLV